MALKFRALDLTSPINRIAAGFVALAVNVRAYLVGGFALRNPLSAIILQLGAAAPHAIRRLNDSTPNGPPSGYALVIASSSLLYINDTPIATGMSGDAPSLIPFRPNTSVQPWMYVGDISPQGAVTITTKYLISGDGTTFVCSGMVKVRSDGLIYKMGIKEPQLAPVVSTSNSTITTSATLEATAIPWTNYLGQNPDYNFGETNGLPSPTPDGTPPLIVNVENASFVTIASLTGTAHINGGTAGPSTAGPSPALSTNPGHYIMQQGTGTTPPASATVVTGAFTDGAGNVIPAGVAPLFIPAVVDVGAVIGFPNAITVPFGAVSFQIGINSTGNTYSANSGSFALVVDVTTNALPSKTSILGTLNLSYWGDSPTSGAVGGYIWKNPDDPGGNGPTRSTSNAVGTATGNSFIFDATFTAGEPGLPGVGNDGVPMEWTTLSPESVATGESPVFPSPLTETYPTQTTYANFNFCVSGNLYFPSAGNYNLVLTSHDDCMWGIGGGVTLVSATATGSGEGSGTALSTSGQTITVVNGYPLLPRQKYTSGLGGLYAQTTYVIAVPNAGIYPVEIDYDYWFHSGRILLLQAGPTPGGAPTVIPPLPANVRQEVQYRYTYRSTATGATSNPSPESTAETVPVTANTITSLWSDDPQVDVVDYYRLDSVTSDFTYVATGPNDNLGPDGTNTPISDSLTDTELGTQLLSFDNFEPFPVTDLPQKGTLNSSGGVLTWVSGGAIGGTATGFNIRWLAGTVILIGSPTSLAYTFIARPTSNTSVTIPGVPDGANLVYEIEEPTLAAQPLPYLWGPSDNIPFACGCGDPINPGVMYWCEGNNLDAAPDTNQINLTDPSEALVNGCYTGGKALVFTIRRAIAVLPNYFNALATATGTVGTTWSVRTTGINRGLFIPRCLCVSGGGLVYFRVDDGIHISQGGGASESITDETLYPLFSHEGSAPTAITRNGVTIYPPDDTQPFAQKFSYQNGYMYYDYIDINDVPRTLVWDEAAMGWISDTYTPPVTCHAPDEGESTQGCLVGCTDAGIRQFTEFTAGVEGLSGTVLTAAIGGIGYVHAFELTVEYASTGPVTLSFLAPDVGNGSYAPAAITLASTSGAIAKFTTKLSPNKWKLLQMQFVSSDPGLQVYLEGTILNIKEWGSNGSYRPVNPFTPSGGAGGQA